MRQGKAAVTDNSKLALSSFSFAIGAASLTKMDKLAAAVTTVIAPFGITAAASGMVSGEKAVSWNPRPHLSNELALSIVAPVLAAIVGGILMLPFFDKGRGRAETSLDQSNG
jgi:hypothetical protein